MITVVPITRATPGWSPSPFQAPAIRPRLAQAVTTTPVTPPGYVMVPVGDAPNVPFIDSALVSFVVASLGVTAYYKLSSWSGHKDIQQYGWSKIYAVVALALAIKAGYDLTQIRTR